MLPVLPGGVEISSCVERRLFVWSGSGVDVLYRVGGKKEGWNET